MAPAADSTRGHQRFCRSTSRPPGPASRVCSPAPYVAAG